MAKIMTASAILPPVTAARGIIDNRTSLSGIRQCLNLLAHEAKEAGHYDIAAFITIVADATEAKEYG